MHGIFVSDPVLFSGTPLNDCLYLRLTSKHSCALHKKECRGQRDMAFSLVIRRRSY